MTNTNRKRLTIYPFDWMYLGYCAVMICLIIIFARPLSEYLGDIVFYIAAMMVALIIVRFVDEKTNRLFALIRLLYPMLMFTFLYTETGNLMLIVFDNFFDPELVRFEMAIFGVSPTLYLDRNLTHLIWANELFSFGYFSYYFMFPVFLLTALLKQHYENLKTGITAISLAFYVSYLIFVLFPVESPRWFLADQYINTITGPLLRPMVDYIIASGGLHGGGMPSSHVAVALVIMFCSLRYYPLLGRVLVPINILLAAGTVWGRFHYVSDVVAGILVGILALVIVWRYFDSSRPTMSITNKKESASEHVS